MELNDATILELMREVGSINKTVVKIEQMGIATYEQACNTNGKVADLTKRVVVLENDKVKESGEEEEKEKLLKYFRYGAMALIGSGATFLFKFLISLLP